MLNLFLSMCEWGASAPKGITKATDQGLTHVGWNRLAAFSCPLPQPSLFSLFVTGIAREGEEFGKLRAVPDLRSGPSVSSNPSYPSITGVGGDYKFPGFQP